MNLHVVSARRQSVHVLCTVTLAFCLLVVGFSSPILAETPLTWNYSYDVEGRITQIQSPSGVINYEYSLVTGRKTVTWTGMDSQNQYNRIEYAYDALGRLKAVRCNGASLDPAYITQYSYNPVGSVETVTYPNGFHSVYEYDALNRLKVLTHNLSSQPEAMMLAKYEYSYYADGMRAKAVETLLNSDTLDYDSREVIWKYDELNRVTEERLTGGYTLQFQYDLVGNCLQRTLDGTPTYFFCNDRDELLKESPNADGSSPTVEYEYDANGSLRRKVDHVSGKEIMYEYNLQNRLQAVFEDGQEIASYLYHPEGYRLGKEAGGTMVWYLSDPYNPTGYAQVLEEVSDGQTTTYFHGLHVLGQKTVAGDPMFFLPDGHGSTRQTVQMPVTSPPPATAPTMQQIHYDAYGKLLPGTAPATNVLYTNQRFDPDLGMYDLRRREYDPSNMRFTQHDPWSGRIDDPMSLHRYLYCHANPINAFDPSGCEYTLAQKVAVIGIGLNVGSLVGNVIHGIYLDAHGDHAGAAEARAWAMVDLAFLCLPFGGPGAGMAQTAGPIVQNVMRMSKAGMSLSAIWGYVRTAVAAGEALGSGESGGSSGGGGSNGPSGGEFLGNEPALPGAKWYKFTIGSEAFQKAAAEYQSFVTGKPVGHELFYNGYRFDGFRNGALIDAKHGYESLIQKNGQFYDFMQVEFRDLAIKMTRAAGGKPVIIRCASPELKQAVQDAIEGIGGIAVDCVPSP